MRMVIVALLWLLVLPGAVMAALERFDRAEAELLEAQTIIEGPGIPGWNPLALERQTREVVESFADLYDAWHASEPDAGHDAEAEKWRSRLDHITSDEG